MSDTKADPFDMGYDISMKVTSEITVGEIMQCGSDQHIVAAARVSTNGEECLRTLDEEGELKGTINYLMKHRHGSPFEHGFLTVYVHAPIFVWREWHRHRIGFSYNEESGRYKTLDPVFYVPYDDRPAMKVEGWKPGRPKFLPWSTLTHTSVNTSLKDSYIKAYETYIRILSKGVDPGLARDCLPVGIYSGCWVSCNPRSIMSFLSLRTHHPEAAFVSYPLYEINVAADKLEEIFKQHWPITHAAFVENGRVAP